MAAFYLNFSNYLAPGVIGAAEGATVKCHVHLFSRATMTNYHKLDGYNNHGLFPGSGSLKPELKGSYTEDSLIVRKISIYSRPLCLIGDHLPPL